MSGTKEYGFPRAMTIKSCQEITRVKTKGRFFRSVNLSLCVHGEREAGATKFAVLLSRGFRTAVARNRVKRVIREYLRHHKSTFPVGSMALVFAPGRIGLSANAEIRQELDAVFASHESRCK